VNREKPPFNDPNLRKAMTLAIDRKAMNDIISQGKSIVSGPLLAPPAGVWGMSSEALAACPATAARRPSDWRQRARSWPAWAMDPTSA
jgi:ABC-type transport system substrate-binding protein